MVSKADYLWCGCADTHICDVRVKGVRLHVLWTAPAASWTVWRSSLSLVGKVPDIEKADSATYRNVTASAGHEPPLLSCGVYEPFQFWICSNPPRRFDHHL